MEQRKEVGQPVIFFSPLPKFTPTIRCICLVVVGFPSPLLLLLLLLCLFGVPLTWYQIIAAEVEGSSGLVDTATQSTIYYIIQYLFDTLRDLRLNKQIKIQYVKREEENVKQGILT